MKKKLNKQIKKAIKLLPDCTPEEALIVSNVIVNLMNAKQVAKNIKAYM